MLDQRQLVTTALPAANASANSASLNLGPVTGGVLAPVSSGSVGPMAHGLTEVRIGIDATPNLANTKNIVMNLQHSLDNGSTDTWANVPGTGNMSVVGPSSGGAAAAEFRLYLPPNTKPWIRATAAVDASGGTNTSQNFYLKVAI